MLEKNPQDKKPLVIIFLTVFIYLLGFGIVIPTIPLISTQLGATALQTGLLMSAYSFMQFLFSPFWGRLSDKMGRRPILFLRKRLIYMFYFLLVYYQVFLGLQFLQLQLTYQILHRPKSAQKGWL
jgi:MFS family permease